MVHSSDLSTNTYGCLARLQIDDEPMDTPEDYSTSEDDQTVIFSQGSGDHSSEDDTDDDDDESAYVFSVDLSAQEAKHQYKPVYTRRLLLEIQDWRETLLDDLELPVSRQEHSSIEVPGADGTLTRIWEAEDAYAADTVTVHYMSRVEMHPRFQEHFGKESQQIRLLRQYNPSFSPSHFSTPYAIKTFSRLHCREHQDAAAMERYRHDLLHTKALWLKSDSQARLVSTVHATAARCSRITQLVCFGLGSLSLKRECNDYAAVLQYMAVFSIAHTLTRIYAKADPSAAPVRVICQDPCYEAKDRILLPKLFGRDIEFVADPDGLLRIDSGTLVVTAFLPVQVPLMQIVADLFAEKPGNGPVAVIGDRMQLEEKRKGYSLKMRDSPAVARHFTRHYGKVVDAFKGHKLETELAVDVLGKEGARRCWPYWLTQMDLLVRKM